MKLLNNKWWGGKWYDFRWSAEGIINDLIEAVPGISIGLVILAFFIGCFHFMFKTLAMLEPQYIFIIWIYYVVVNDAMLSKYPLYVQLEGETPGEQIAGIMMGPITTMRYIVYHLWNRDSRFLKWYYGATVERWEAFANKHRIRLV